MAHKNCTENIKSMSFGGFKVIFSGPKCIEDIFCQMPQMMVPPGRATE